MNVAEQPPETHHRPRERGRILSRREIIVGLTALALLGAALVGLVADVYPRVAMVVVVVTFTVNAVTLARSLR